MLQIQTGEQSVAESVALLKALSRGRRDWQGTVWRIELSLLPLVASEWDS